MASSNVYEWAETAPPIAVILESVGIGVLVVAVSKAVYWLRPGRRAIRPEVVAMEGRYEVSSQEVSLLYGLALTVFGEEAVRSVLRQPKWDDKYSTLLSKAESI